MGDITKLKEAELITFYKDVLKTKEDVIKKLTKYRFPISAFVDGSLEKLLHEEWGKRKLAEHRPKPKKEDS